MKSKSAIQVLMTGVAFSAFMVQVSPLYAQQIQVKGVVKDSKTGEPLSGVSIRANNTIKGSTDKEGNFKFEVSEGTSNLEFKLIGYESQIIKGGSSMLVSLVPVASQLDEVVVVGYGTQKKATLTGAITSLNGDVLENRPVSNVAVGLQGQVPGLTITRTSARPGSEDLAIQLRGASSINKVEPLIIIDGVPAISNTEFSSLNPNDIENVSVLKDASAAIYGSRAAGGVILVTTKKGKKGDKSKVTFNGMATANTPANMLPLAGMKVFAETMVKASYQDYVQSDGKGGEVITQRAINGQTWNDVYKVGGKIPYPGVSFEDTNMLVIDQMALGAPFTYVDANNLLHYYESNNWLDLIYGTSFSTQDNLAIQGSSERARWAASLGYANDRSIIKATKDGVKKYNSRINADYDLNKWLTLNMNISYNNRNLDSPLDGLDGNNSGMYDAPAAPAYTPSGNYYDFYVSGRSPLSAMQAGGRSKQEFETFRYSSALTAQLTRDLKATGTIAFTKNNNVQTEYKTTYYVGAPYVTGKDPVTGDYIINEQLNVVNQGTRSYVQERVQRTSYENYAFQLDYNRTFNDRHNVSAMAGVNAEKSTYKNVTAKRTDLLYEGLFDINTASSGAANQTATGGSNAWGFISYLTRLNYNYDGKYIFELLGRRDGTSKFHPNYRWSNFGAASVGYRISEEKFIKENVTFLNDLKLRSSYGVTGGAVSGLGNYDYLSSMALNTYYFNGGFEQTAYLSNMTDYTRTWERLRSFNVGVDFSFLNNRLTGSFDWYEKRNNNMLVSLIYPDVLGANPPATNNAKLQVKGWEAILGWNDKAGEVSYWLNASVNDARSKVTDYSGKDAWNAGLVSVRQGYALNSLFVYKTDGYFSNYDEISQYYKQYAGNSALGNVAESSVNTHLRPGDRKKLLILDPNNDDTNGKGNTGAGDVYYYGDTDPHFNFGFTAGAKWRNFDFSFFLQGVGRRYLLREGGLNTSALYASYTNLLTTHLDTWTWENQDASYARLSLQQNKNKWNVDNNDSAVQNAWYARLKNVSLGYTIPSTISNKLKIDKLRFYFSGDNIAEISGLTDGYDPEKGATGRTSLPFSRSWTFGVDLTF